MAKLRLAPSVCGWVRGVVDEHALGACAGIPARVINELMGHEATGRTGQHRGSAMGAHYRHTTPEMAARAVDAIQQRLTIVLQVAEDSVESHPSWSLLRVF